LPQSQATPAAFRAMPKVGRMLVPGGVSRRMRPQRGHTTWFLGPEAPPSVSSAEGSIACFAGREVSPDAKLALDSIINLLAA
jgi:hypothetical protein